MQVEDESPRNGTDEFTNSEPIGRNRAKGAALMWVLLPWMLSLIALVAAFTTGFWFTVLFWIEMQLMELHQDEWNE